MLSWPAKAPEEVIDYQINWAKNRLAVGETITTTTWVVESGDVVIDSDVQLNGVTTVWLSGGTLGTVSEVVNRIVTSLGRTYDQSVKIRIRER